MPLLQVEKHIVESLNKEGGTSVEAVHRGNSWILAHLENGTTSKVTEGCSV